MKKERRKFLSSKTPKHARSYILFWQDNLLTAILSTRIRESLSEINDIYLSLSRDLSSSMRLRRSSSRCSRKRCAASACCLSSSNFRCRSSFCLSRTSFALSNSFELPVDSRPANNRIERHLVLRTSIRTAAAIPLSLLYRSPFTDNWTRSHRKMNFLSELFTRGSF